MTVVLTVEEMKENRLLVRVTIDGRESGLLKLTQDELMRIGAALKLGAEHPGLGVRVEVTS